MVIYAYLKFPNLLLDAQGVSHHNECVAILHQCQIMQCSKLRISSRGYSWDDAEHGAHSLS